MTYLRNSHCSFCGHAFAQDAPWPRLCAQCGNVSYINPLPVAVLLLPVIQAGHTGLLTVRRSIEPQLGKLAFPGGFMEIGESWQAACARELGEETGIEVDAAKLTFFRALSSPGGHLLLFGLAPAIDESALPPFQPTTEVSEWVIIHQAVDLAFPLHNQAMIDYFHD